MMESNLEIVEKEIENCKVVIENLEKGLYINTLILRFFEAELTSLKLA